MGHDTRWTLPARDTWKLNCDVVVTHVGAKATVGGVLRNDDCAFLLGFSLALGNATVLEAELLAILIGVKVVQERGYTRVDIENDSLLTVC